jgi:hypothetical protein
LAISGRLRCQATNATLLQALALVASSHDEEVVLLEELELRR